MLFKLKQYGLLMRLDKPIGIYLLLWPTLWALWVAAGGLPERWVFIVFVAGVVLMRSAGCVINDFADRKIDPHVARTRHRPLASGKVKASEALLLFVGLALVAFLLVMTMNRLTIMLSLVGVLLAASYPFAKRFHQLPQLHLGIAFAWAVPMAYAAQLGAVTVEAWLLLAVTVLWTTAYDTMYGMVDREDDLKIGVKSTAILFGRNDRLIIGMLQAAALAGLAWLGFRLGLSWHYWLGFAVAILLSLYQQWLIKDREPAACFKAFLNNHWLGMAVFMGLLLSLWPATP